MTFTKISALFLLLVMELHANEGALLFDGNCATCHLQTKTLSAPSALEIQTSYKSAHADKKDFIASMSAWVAEPNAKTSRMPEAIKKHGLMPELGYDLQTLQAISAYIFESDFSKKI